MAGTVHGNDLARAAQARDHVPQPDRSPDCPHRGITVHSRAGRAATLRRVNDPGRPSEGLVLQRMRNRAMEALVPLSEGDGGVRSVGNVEFVEEFFDIIDDDAPWHWRDWSCFTSDEVEGLSEVHELLKAACSATLRVESDDDFIASGWPGRIQPAARAVLDAMQARGRFREDVEEEPSE